MLTKRRATSAWGAATVRGDARKMSGACARLTRDLLAKHTWLQIQEYRLIATEYRRVYRKPIFNGSSID
jgi:hypothetical protein